MPDNKIHARLLPTPFISSFVGRSRPGELGDGDRARRASAWSSWAVSALDQFKGIEDREYFALVLPGAFFDPIGGGPVIRPHLEIPGRVLDRPDPEFPDRLAEAGMATLMPRWILPEVKAFRRALFNTPTGSISGLLGVLASRRAGMHAAYRELSTQLERGWDQIEALLITNPELLNQDLSGDFSTAEIAELIAPATGFGLEVTFDEQLRTSQGTKVSRRVGVWQITGVDNGRRFAMGVVTPRQTRNSLFRDPLFDISREGDAAALVRALLLRRLVNHHLNGTLPDRVAIDPIKSGVGQPFLRAVAARVGAKLPEASEPAAIHFLQRHPTATEGWAALCDWADGRYVLTVTEEQFVRAFDLAKRNLRRAEPPTRDDINLVLPIAWHEGKIVRVTFSLPDQD